MVEGVWCLVCRASIMLNGVKSDGRGGLMCNWHEVPAQTCEPPPEARDVRWHWVRFKDQEPRPVEWRDGAVWELPAVRLYSPRDMYRLGYHYVAPIPLPE